MLNVETKLFYGQKVYVAMPQCTCSENTHDLKYTKLAAGYVRKYNSDTDSYMIEITESSERTTVNSYCPCEDNYVNSNVKVVLKEIPAFRLFVLNLPEREFGYEETWLKTGDIINVYPYSEKYKVLAFNNDFTLMLVSGVDSISSSGAPTFSGMKVVDLNSEDTFISQGDGIPVIPYKYQILEVEDEPGEDEPTQTPDDSTDGDGE